MPAPTRLAGRRQLITLTAAVIVCLGPWVASPAAARTQPAMGWVAPIGPPLVVARGFDPPSMRWLAGHRGVDIATHRGATVRATGAGVVTYAGLVAGRGVIVVSHTGTNSGLRTTVEPVNASVVMGQHVAAGEPIGAVAETPGHCAPAVCVHWGLLRGDTYLDPLRVGAAVQARLLPLGALTLPHPSAALTRSGPRVSLLVRPTQPFDRHVGVDLGSRQ
jgi:murein DD-endopeptidase MepM/ murein hydrolase activator NlpD